MKKFRHSLIFLVGTFPASGWKNKLLNLLGYEISRAAVICPVILHRVSGLTVGEGARIGPFNVFRDLMKVRLGDGAIIGQWNWLSASSELVSAGGAGTFTLGREAALTSRHYVDCSGGVKIGDLTTVAGVRSTFITHGIDWKRNEQQVRGIIIGERCLISSNVCIPPGTEIGSGIIVGMGATVGRSSHEDGSLYISPRAEVVRKGLAGGYFAREKGAVQPGRK